MFYRSHKKQVSAGIRLTVFGLLCFSARSSLAHAGVHEAVGFQAGFIHPFSGIDHLLAMISAGVLAAQMKGKARWQLPLLFLSAMGVGAIPGLLGIVMPGIELGIATSLAVFGIVIACALSMPFWMGAMLVAAFGIVHGAAHGMEMQYQVTPGFYAAGFLLATASLQLIGLSMSVFSENKFVSNSLRLLGALIAAEGVFLMMGAA